FHVRIDKCDEFPARVGDTTAKCVALAHIAVVLNHFDVRRDHTLSLASRLVGVTVRYHDDLIATAKSFEFPQKFAEITLDVTRFAVGGHDDRELDPWRRDLVTARHEQPL